MLDLLKEIWQTMRTNKLRTMLTGLSVAWGIFMLILLLAIAKGVVNSSERFYDNNSPERLSVWPGTTSKPYQGLKEGRAITFTDRSLQAIERSTDKHIASASAQLSFSGTVSTSKDYISNSCTGVSPDFFTGHYKILQGRAINEADMRYRRKTVVLSRKHLPVLFYDTLSCVGSTVTIGGLAFTVVGVYDNEWETSPLIPFSTAEALAGYDGKYEQIDVQLQGLSGAEQSEASAEAVRQALGRQAGFDPDDKEAVWVHDRFASYLMQKKGNSILNWAMWIIGLLTLITGIVGVSNIMFISVRERTHEIGIRRAIGAKPRSILLQVVLESVAMTTGFGYIGIVMGTLATEIVKKAFAGSSFMLDPSVDLSIAIEVTAALVIAGALAGAFPAMKAIKVRPVEALRDE